MELSENGKNMIKFFEGCRLTPYQDTAGNWTVGYGHLTNSRQSITQKRADDFFNSDVAKCVKRVNALPYGMNQYQFDALVSFDFNTGALSRLTAGNTRSLASLPSYMRLYNKSGGKYVPGLQERRNIEIEVFNAFYDGQIEALFKRNKIPYSMTIGSFIGTGYTIGKVYTTQVGLNVREKPSVDARILTYEELTRNAQEHDINPQNGSLDAGTRVSCLNINVDMEKGFTWMQIPSGWICAIQGEKVYIE